MHIRFSGVLKGPEALEAVRELVRDSSYTTGTNTLVDLRSVDSVEIYGEEVRAGADLVRRLGDAFAGARCALVASSDTAYGIIRQYELMLAETRFETRSFRDFEEARAWITDEDGA